MGGNILGILNGKAIEQPLDSTPNRNTLVVGGPGSFKTQSYVITNVLNQTETSIVVTDPKGEVFEQTAAIKELQGFEVHVVNFDMMNASDRYNPIDYVRKDTEATTVATKIVSANNADGKKDVWYLSQRQFLKALILYAVHELEPKKQNMRGILEFFQSFSVEPNKKGESELGRQFEALPFEHPARKAWDLGVKKAKGEMLGSIVMSLLSTISDYVDAEVAEFTSFSDFHLTDIGNKKIALYVIIPTMDNAWEGLINLFFSQMFQELYKFASLHHAKLPQPVTFYLDEFVNLGKFDSYEEFLATCRGYGIGVSTIIQTITQLQDKYNEKKAESIIGNCAVKIFLDAANHTTAKYVSDMLDKTTVRVETESSTKQHGKEQNSSSVSDGENYSARSLMTPGEVERMPADTAIVFMKNRHPVKVKKAKQFQLFPGATEYNLRNQSQYKSNPSKAQIDDFEERERKFFETISDKEMAKAERLKMQFDTEQLEAEKEQNEKLADFFGVVEMSVEEIDSQNDKKEVTVDISKDKLETDDKGSFELDL